MSMRYSKPYYSQLHINHFELLCLVDDPVFQVCSRFHLLVKILSLTRLIRVMFKICLNWLDSK